jgi:hypothetical protein
MAAQQRYFVPPLSLRRVRPIYTHFVKKKHRSPTSSLAVLALAVLALAGHLEPPSAEAINHLDMR